MKTVKSTEYWQKMNWGEGGNTHTQTRTNTHADSKIHFYLNYKKITLEKERRSDMVTKIYL